MGDGGVSFLERQQGGMEAALPAQFRLGCPFDVPLRFGIGQGNQAIKGRENGAGGQEEEKRGRGHA